jgi:hypothetical protein
MARQPAWKKKKTYGQYKTKTCPFCTRMATQTNDAGVDVCYQHRTQKMEEIKCTCGSWLEQKSGKFGAYFNCINCGNFNHEKGMEIKALTKGKAIAKVKPKPISYMDLASIPKKTVSKPKEVTISSDDMEYFD